MSDEIEVALIKQDFDSANCPSLLAYLEQEQIPVHYHCRDGFCGACRTKLIEGSVTYQKEPLAFIRKGEFLPCCSTPASDLIIKTEK